MTETLAPRERRARPIRALEIAAFVCLLGLILWVYVAKAAGADERAVIRETEADIRAEQARIRLLEAEAAHLEQPVRLEALAREHTDLGPVEPARETRPEALDGLAPSAEPAP